MRPSRWPMTCHAPFSASRAAPERASRRWPSALIGPHRGAQRAGVGRAYADGRFPSGRPSAAPPRAAEPQGCAGNIRRAGIRATCSNGCAQKPITRSTSPVSTATSSNRWPPRWWCCQRARLVVTEGNYLLLDDPALGAGRAGRWTVCGSSPPRRRLRTSRLDRAAMWSSERNPSRRRGPGSPKSMSETQRGCREPPVRALTGSSSTALVNGSSRSRHCAPTSVPSVIPRLPGPMPPHQRHPDCGRR